MTKNLLGITKNADRMLEFFFDKEQEGLRPVEPPEYVGKDKSVPETSVALDKREPATTEARPEDVKQAELNKAINDFEAKQSQIAEMKAKKTNRFASLAKSLGIKTRSLNDDPEVMSLEKDSNDLYRNLIAKGIRLYNRDKPQLENFLKQFDEFDVFKKNYNQEIDIRAKVAGFPENILAGFHTLTKKWGELKTWQKIAVGAGGGLLVAGGTATLGAGTFGAAALGAGYRWGFRAFGAAAAGVGRNVMLDRQMMTKMESEAEARLKERMDSLEKYENNLDQGIEDILGKTGIGYIRKDFEQRRIENTLRATKFALITFGISSFVGEGLRLGGQYTGINMGSILKKIGGYAGIGEGTMTQQPADTLYTKGPDGKVYITPKGFESIGDTPAESVSLPPEDLEKVQNLAEAADAEAKARAMGEFAKSPAAGADVPESKLPPDTTIKEATESPVAGAEVQAPEIEEPKNILLGENNVKSGGGIERSAKAIIKANPREFDLDPGDPKLNAKAGQRAHILARGLADKYGMTYKELNEIASSKVQVGDEIRIYKDPVTGKPNLTYNGGAFDDVLSPDNASPAEVPDVKAYQAVSADEISKPKIVPGDARVKASAAELQSQKTGAKIVGMEEIEADYQKDLADRSYARAVQAEQDWQVRRERIANLNEHVGYEATLRQGVATRGTLKNIIHDAGIGNNVSLWDESAEKWYREFSSLEKLISQDVLQNDSVDDINKKREILKMIFSQLPKPQPGETTWKAFSRALYEDPENLVKLNNVLNKR